MKTPAESSRCDSTEPKDDREIVDAKDTSSPLGNAIKEVHCIRGPGRREEEAEAEKEDSVVEVDGLPGWIVVGSSFLCWFVSGVMYVAFSILYLEFERHFDCGMGAAGWIGSLYYLAGSLFGIVNSMIIEHKGCRFLACLGSLVWTSSFALSALAVSTRHLYLTYGVLGGLGFNMVALSSFVIVQKHFRRSRSIAAGLSATGISFGSLSSGPLIGYFVSTYGWRGTLLFMSGIAFNCCVFGCFYRSPRPLNHSKPGNGKAITSKTTSEADRRNSGKATPRTRAKAFLLKLCDPSLLKDPHFAAFCFAEFCFSIGTSIFHQHSLSRAVAHGVEKSSAYFIMTVAGTLSLISRIVGASIGNAECSDRILQFGLYVAACGLSLLSTGFAARKESIFAVAGLTGLCSGLAMTIRTTVITDIVGFPRMSRAQAVAMVFIGLAAFLGIPLAGFTYDRTKNYSLPFYIAGGMQVLGGLTMTATHLIVKTTRSSPGVPTRF